MRAVWLVFAKEARETFRDRRVVQGSFLGPAFMVVLFAVLFGAVEASLRKPPKPSVAVVGRAAGEVERNLISGVAADVTTVADREAGSRLLAEGKVRLVLDFGRDFTAGIAQEGAVLTVVYDSRDTMSQVALATVRTAVQTMNQSVVRGVLAQAGLPSSAAEPIRLVTLEAQKPEGLGSSSFAGLLPYLIVLWAFYGGFSQVADLVAGEKERGTMETLLATPARRWQIVLGKLLALALTCLVSALSSLAALVAVGGLNLPQTRALFPDGLAISGPGTLAIAVLLLALVAMFATLLMAVSARARTMREAQAYLTLVSFVVLMPAVFSQFVGFVGVERAAWVRWTPILNAAVAMREALIDRVVWPGVFATLATSLGLAALFLWATLRQFMDESILARS